MRPPLYRSAGQTLLVICLIITGCATPEQKAAERKTDAQKQAEQLQKKYANLTTAQLQLKRQELAASIPAWYWGTGIVGLIQQGQIEGKKKEVAEIDRELLRRAESGDTSAQKKIAFIVLSDPPGARIEVDGRYVGIAPQVLEGSADLGATITIRATPTTLDFPMVGFVRGYSITNGRLVRDLSAGNLVGYVCPNTPAAQMGLVQGDRVIGVNGRTLPDIKQDEDAEIWHTSFRTELTRVGFGGDITLKVARNGREVELRGRTCDQVEGVYYAQEKSIQPHRFDKQIILFDMRIQTESPIALGGGSATRAVAPKGTTSTGTGFVIAEGGYVLTCEHVVRKCEEIQVRDSIGATYKGKIIASDSGNDLCLLKVDGLTADPIKAAPPNSVNAGETIYSLGYPMSGVLENQSPVAGNGVVASLRGLKGDPRHLQVTVPVNPGNSGGPILDGYGRWVAVASHKLSDFYGLATTGQTPQGINFAVKGSLVVPLFDSIPEVKLPVTDSKENVSLENVVKQFSRSVLFITATH